MVEDVSADASEEWHAGEFRPERWRSVIGWEGLYEISNHGQLRRARDACGTRAGSHLSDSVLRKGYICNVL
jgi:hypothetical protein